MIDSDTVFENNDGEVEDFKSIRVSDLDEILEKKIAKTKLYNTNCRFFFKKDE